MSNNDNASTIDQTPHDSSQHVSERKITTGLNDSSPTPFRMSSPNTSTDNDVHLLRFSIPFRVYQSILETKTISSITSSHHDSTHSSDPIERSPPPPLLTRFSPIQFRPHRDLRPQSTVSKSPQSSHTGISDYTAATTDLSTMSPLPAAVNGQRYSYVTSPTNTSPESGNEMIPIDKPHHIRFSSALYSSDPFTNSSTVMPGPCQCHSIHSKSQISLSKLNFTLFNKHEGTRVTSNFWPPNRKVSPTINVELPSSFEERKVETVESEVVGGLETHRSETNHASINSVRCDLAHRPRRSSLFAGRGTYIDVESSVMQFPIREFRPLIERRWWNEFMYSSKMQKKFLCVAGIVVVLASLSVFLFDSMSIGSMHFQFVSFSILIVLMMLMLTHWLDKILLREVLTGWEAMLCFLYLIVCLVTGIWNSLYDPTVSRPLRVAVSCVSTFGATLGFSFVLLSDCCPRSLFPRRIQMAAYLSVALAECFAWIRFGILHREREHELPTICIYGCMTITQLLSLAAGNLSMFAFKYFLSLLIWPDSAVILKARISIER